tara:strand:+ start:220 stop:591 length:372 start_codon:yes stop_codon:yes gene_type:complete
MGKKKVMDLSIGDTTYVDIKESKFPSQTNDKNTLENLEKTTPSAYTLPMLDVALLKAVAFSRGAKGGKASASAVLQEILKEHREKLIDEADEYIFITTLKKMTNEMPDEAQIKQILSAKVALL